MITGKATVAATVFPEKDATTTQTAEARMPTGYQALSVKSEAFAASTPVCVEDLEPGTGGATVVPALMRRWVGDVHKGIFNRISELANVPNWECAGCSMRSFIRIG